jgi:hypothetical protein
MQWLNSLIAGLVAIYLFFFPVWLVLAYKYGRRRSRTGTLISIIIFLITVGLYVFLDHILHLSPNGFEGSGGGILFAAGVIMVTVLNSLGMMAGVLISFLDATL